MKKKILVWLLSTAFIFSASCSYPIENVYQNSPVITSEKSAEIIVSGSISGGEIKSGASSPAVTASGDHCTDADSDFLFDYEDVYGKNTAESYSKTGYLFSDKLGSCGDIAGTTAIVSIFVKDERTDWNTDIERDEGIYDQIVDNLRISTGWVRDSAAEYGIESDFIYDWDEYPELCVYAGFDVDFQRDIDSDHIDYAVWDFIENEIDTEGIMRRLKAQNIVYMLYINTPDDGQAVTCTRNNYYGMDYPYEMCFFFMSNMGEVEWPAVFAHELLHTFGAPDLYMPDEQFGITQEYVDYAERTYLNDIMCICSDPYSGSYYYDKITNPITEITAYYIGFTDHSDTADKWGLGKSEHIIK